MCGFLVYKSENLKKDKINSKSFNSALSLIKHRGPDAETKIIKKSINTLIGFQRLEIRDKDFGLQPMEDKKNHLLLSFNGEVFNDNSLRSELEKIGYKFKSKNSDTEVILHGYKEWGTKVFNKLRGFFSIVIIDSKLDKIFMARDYNGIKPLYYYTDAEKKLIICSELDPIKCLLDQIRIDVNSVYYTLSMLSPPTNKTIYKDIKTVNPGTLIELDLKNHQLLFEDFFNFQSSSFSKNINTEEKISHTLCEWLKSDVDVAITLSGGIDSTILAILGKKIKPNIKAYSLFLRDPIFKKWDQSTKTKKLAEKIDIDLTEVQINFEEFGSKLENIISKLDQPFCGSYAPWFVFKEIAKDRIKVAVTGTGGDELFGNYERGETYKKEFLHNGIVKPEKILNKLFNLNGYCPLKNVIKHYNNRIMSGGLLNLIEKRLMFQGNNSELRKIADVCSFLELSSEFLYSTDRFSMLNGVEARPVFLDGELRKYVLKNDELCFNKNIYKETLVKIIQKNVKGWIPDKKIGHDLPVSYLMRTSIKTKVLEILSEDLINYIGIFNYTEIKDIINNFFNGSNSNVQFIWSLFTLHMWFKTHDFKVT